MEEAMNDRASGHAVVIERGTDNVGACSPDVPGCISTGATAEEALANMAGALAVHLEYAAARRADPRGAPRR